MLQWFTELPFVNFLALLAGANLVMYLSSWVVVRLIQRLFHTALLNANAPHTSLKEGLLSLLIVLINIGVGIPGWLLWKAHWIELEDNGLPRFLLDVSVLILYFDFSMYVLHRAMHQGPLYRRIHSRHHEHVDVSGISFYIMNPLEALGFGALLILFLVVHPTNFYALLVYLTLNWAYGTMGHSGIAIRSRLLRWLVGDSEFHHRHHTGQKGNYGF